MTGNNGDSPLPKRRRRSTRIGNIREKALGGEQDGRRNTFSEEEFNLYFSNMRDSKSKSAETLKVISVDTHLKTNRKLHHTDEFDQSDLIVRRGSPMTLSFTFQRDIRRDDDIVTLQFVIGNKPQESKGTVIRLPVLGSAKKQPHHKLKRRAWDAKCLRVDGSELQVEVTPTPNSFVGTFSLFVETKNADEEHDEPERYEYEANIYILFNPWCEADTVYMEDEEKLNEYVLNESGRIWVGNERFNHGQAWNFGQFEEPCLDAALFLLEKGELAENGRKDPVAVIRCLAAMTNSNDDNGLIEGRWTLTFPKNCTKPTTWTGSVAIIKEFMKTLKPVQYGQCWVFSGLVTTLLRSLGIPTRSVTNFESAHDTDQSMTVDYHFDQEDEPMTYLNDSIWNFHVWNESWLRRPDLPHGYDGWQVHDATPQELSQGVMRCGPASVTAIKEGHVYLNYDIPFIFAEVNGDKIYWSVKDDNEMEPLKIDKKAIGKSISTKAVGSYRREDITCNYKYPEGSEKERNVIQSVNKYSSRDDEDIYNIDIVEDVDFELLTLREPVLGHEFEIGLNLKSKSKSSRTVKVTLTLFASFYTGVTGKRIKCVHEEVSILPGKESTIKMAVSPEDYEAKVTSDGTMLVFVTANVLSTKQTFVKQINLILEKPALVIKHPDRAELGTEFDVAITFTNPLNVALTNVIFNIEGAGLTAPLTICDSRVVPAMGEITKELQLIPRRSGNRQLSVTFTSDQLDGIEGIAEIYVKYSY